MGRERLVKSKDRVKQSGEVYTPANIVNDMLSLQGVNEYSYDLDKTFLEPACGNGNFLIQILARKLKTCRDFALQADDVGVAYDLCIIRALASIYAVDILGDNVMESRDRLLKFIMHGYDIYGVEAKYLCGAKPYREVTGHDLNSDMHDIFDAILQLNIVHGDALSGIEYDAQNQKGYAPFTMIQYEFTGDKIRTRPFMLEEVKNGHHVASQFSEPHYWNDVEHYLSLLNADDDEELDF